MAVTAAALQAADAQRATTDQRIDQVTRDLVAAWATAWATLEVQLTVALSTLVAGAARWPTRAQILASYQMQSALADVQAQTAQLTAYADTQTRQALDATVRDTAAAQAAIIAAQLPAGMVLSAALTTVPAATLTGIIDPAAANVAAALRPLPAAVADRVRSDIIRGHRDTDVYRAARQVIAQAEQHSSAALARALLIARTEIADAERAAAQAAQDQAAPVLAGWRWVAELTTSTCPSCWAMHGTLHPLDEPGPLDHPAGRCRRVPVLKPWSELGLPGPEPDDAFPDAQAAFWALPRADQLRIMGPGRLRLLETGRITWADLTRRRDNPGWRPSYTTVPIRDLT